MHSTLRNGNSVVVKMIIGSLVKITVLPEFSTVKVSDIFRVRERVD